MHTHTISTIVLAGIVTCFVLVPAAHAHPGHEKAAKAFFAKEHRSRIEGVWDSVVIVHACGDTGAEIRSFRALNLFQRDGSLVATSVAVPPPSLGKWKWLGGRRYRAEFRLLRLDPAGDFAGSQQVTRLIELGPTPDTFSSVVRIEVFGIDDQPLGAPGCAMETARRVF